MSKIITRKQFLQFVNEQKCNNCDIRNVCDNIEAYTNHGLCYFILEHLD